MQVNPRGLTGTTTLALLVTVLFAGCSSLTEPRTTRDLAAARARWASTAPASYDFTVAPSCFCVGNTRPTTVVVEGGTVTSARYADTGEPVPQAIAQSEPTVDSLFAKIEHALATRDETVDASYDATLGFPLSISFNRAPPVPDMGFAYFVRDFHPR